MRSTRQFSVVDMHSAGAPARVVVAGAPVVPGATIAEQRRYYVEHHDDVRKLLMYEPRGFSEMCGSILLEPCDPTADIGIVFIETGGWVEMCGAGTIGAATMLVETGRVEVVEPVTAIRFDTPVGIVTANVAVSGGAVQGVTIENVPSYLEYTDRTVSVEGHGDVLVDIAFGGNHYAVVKTADLRLGVRPEMSAELAEAGRRVRAAVNEQLDLRSPVDGMPFSVPMVLLCDEPTDESTRVLVFFGESGIDRSPGGTGTSARLAQQVGRGELGIGEPYVQESIIGSRFTGVATGTVRLGEMEAIVPSVTGRAFITALTTFVLDPDDPFDQGFGVGYGSDATAKGQRAAVSGASLQAAS